MPNDTTIHEIKMCIGIISGYGIFFLTHPTFPAHTHFHIPFLFSTVSVCQISCESFCLTKPCDLQTLRLLSEPRHTCPPGCYFFGHCIFFHWERGKPCNNGGLLMRAGSEDVVLVIQGSQGCESTKVWHIFNLLLCLPPGHWLCATLNVLQRFTFDFIASWILCPKLWCCCRPYMRFTVLLGVVDRGFESFQCSEVDNIGQCGKPLEVRDASEFMACSVKKVLWTAVPESGRLYPALCLWWVRTEVRCQPLMKKHEREKLKVPCVAMRAPCLFLMSTLPQPHEWQNNWCPLCLKTFNLE